MAEIPMRCNLQSCRVLLEKKGLVTSCSHIFCQQHAQISVKAGKCLACSTVFNNSYDYNMTDMQPTDQYKAMIITGLNPEQILDITGRSISFYTYQLSNECRLKDDLLKQSKIEMENIKANFKADLDKMHRLSNDMKKELDEKSAEVQKYKDQLMQNNRLLKKLQMELYSCKRQITTFKTTNSPRVDTPSTPSLTQLGLNTGSTHRSEDNDFQFWDDNGSSTPYLQRWQPRPIRRFND
ncbi:E3 ubiquitin-protein ligase CCNB1IP1-like [Onthophagus taurus]|uniref:E3 ubiquitin-protein ligase CCNB1IP1-like n=1 Tax=Onthophagus taurus TaxID=166361 RepID=UPI000C20B012|nr:E3 ubiquitin-protein ligase CCNB1IP1-like [Onthophagus taurus]